MVTNMDLVRHKFSWMNEALPLSTTWNCGEVVRLAYMVGVQSAATKG